MSTGNRCLMDSLERENLKTRCGAVCESD